MHHLTASFHAHATMPVRVLEIKCPHNYQNELKHDKKFYLNPDSSFKENDPYYLQIQLQMFIHNLNDGHFLIFCKQKRNERILLPVTTDNLLKNMLEKLKQYFHKILLLGHFQTVKSLPKWQKNLFYFLVCLIFCP